MENTKKEEDKTPRKYFIHIVKILIIYVIINLLALPLTIRGCKNLYNYPEKKYSCYEEEVERMIKANNYKSKLPFIMENFPKDNKYELKMGDYKNEQEDACYITATIKNFGTVNQTYKISRSKNVIEWRVEATLYVIFALFIWMVLAMMIYFMYYLHKNGRM